VNPLGRVAEGAAAQQGEQHDVRRPASGVDDRLQHRRLVGGIEHQLRECCPVLLLHAPVASLVVGQSGDGTDCFRKALFGL
jgi:hypothetical protein